jgi:hypothetical protein
MPLPAEVSVSGRGAARPARGPGLARAGGERTRTISRTAGRDAPPRGPRRGRMLRQIRRFSPSSSSSATPNSVLACAGRFIPVSGNPIVLLDVESVALKMI